MSSYHEIIISSIGEFGRSQVILMLASMAPKFIIAWSMIMMSFAGADPRWWIDRRMFNETSNTSYTLRIKETCPQSGNDTLHFDTDIYTIVSEWSLVCGREWIPTAITTTQMVGVLTGAAVTGQLGDWFGRKRLMLYTYALDLFVIGIQGFSVNWQMMIVCVFFLGFAMGGFMVLCNVYMMEFIGTKWRTFAGVMPFWGTGVALFGLMFKLFPNWRHLCFSTTVVGLPLLILLWFSPRSVRWLLVHGHFDEAKIVLKSMAKRNKLNEPDLSDLDNSLKKELETEKGEKRLNYLSLFTFKSTRVTTCVVLVTWFTCAFAYYGLTLGVSRLAGDLSLNMFLMGLGEAVCMGLVWLISKGLGRKYTTILLFLCTSLSSFGITIAFYSTTSKFKLATNVLALISRFFLSAAWSSLIIFTTEVYPTVIRSSGYGFASVMARIGGICAPQNKTLANLSAHLPYTVNGVLTLLSCGLCFLLTDTYSQPMDDHMKDNEASPSQSTKEDKIALSEI